MGSNTLNPLASWSLPCILLGLGLALAFGRRHTLWLSTLALLAWATLERAPDFARLWLPLSMIVVSALRDPGLFAPRALLLAAFVGLGWSQAQGDGGALIGLLREADLAVHQRLAPWGLGSLLVLFAASLSLWRWTLRGWPIDLGNALGTTVLAAALGAQAAQSLGLLAIAGLVFAAGVLWAAYRMAFVDPLTGLANRRALDERLASSGWRLAIAMVDVDFFKKLNDRYGHDNGDQVLRAVARELGRTRGASAYRYGGEEFCLVFAGRRIASADAVLEDLRTRIEALRVRLAGAAGTSGPSGQAVRKGQRGGEVSCTVSIGVAERAAERRSAEAVLKAADQALYKAKQKGRNRVVTA